MTGIPDNMKKEKRYFFSVVEEGVLNPAYKGYCGGRVEVYDNKDKSGFASAEYRFFLPEEFMYGFRELFDFKESDKPISIRFDMSDK